MADPFANIIEADLAKKCGEDVNDVMVRNFQLCDTQRGAVVVAVAGVASAVASLVGAFYAAYADDELNEETIDVFWRDLARDIVIHSACDITGEVSKHRAALRDKPVK